jgi:hypothetical protein
MDLIKSIIGLAVLIVFGFLLLCAAIAVSEYLNKPDEIQKVETVESNEEHLEKFRHNLPEQSKDTAIFKNENPSTPLISK